MPKARFIAVAAIVLLAIAAVFVVWRGGSDATRAPATTPAIAPVASSPSAPPPPRRPS